MMSSFFFHYAFGAILLKAQLLATIASIFSKCKTVFQKGLKLMGKGEKYFKF